MTIVACVGPTWSQMCSKAHLHCADGSWTDTGSRGSSQKPEEVVGKMPPPWLCLASIGAFLGGGRQNRTEEGRGEWREGNPGRREQFGYGSYDGSKLGPGPRSLNSGHCNPFWLTPAK